MIRERDPLGRTGGGETLPTTEAGRYSGILSESMALRIASYPLANSSSFMNVCTISSAGMLLAMAAP